MAWSRTQKEARSIKISNRRKFGLCVNCGESSGVKSRCCRCRNHHNKRQRERRESLKTLGLCVNCGNVEIYNGKYYCNECRKEKFKNKTNGMFCKIYYIKCSDCDALVVSNGRYKTIKCYKCYRKIWLKKQRDLNHKRRLLISRQYIEYVDIEVLFARDKSRCQICKQKLNLKRQIPHALAATIDHTIPLYQDGEHSYKNTQLACFRCNSKKGSRTLDGGEQLLLFG